MADIASLERLRQNFQSGITKPYAFRKEQLRKLKNSILKHEEDIYDALFKDLKKSREETWVTETGMVMAELSTAIRNLNQWMKPERTGTNLLNLPSRSRIESEPLGVVLIIGPWNYPFQLLINPLVGAIAAGNTVVLKPSEFAPLTAMVMRKIIEDAFPPEYVFYIEGDGATVVPQMMNNFSFDHVFYTGSTVVGKMIYKMAAERLVPVTLELGGKSPCIVEEDADLKVAARRIAMTKFSNAGQMCVAPDYVFVHENVKEKFLEKLKATVSQFYGEKPEEDYNYGKIINEKQFDRIANYITQGKLYHGGRVNREKLFIEPTILIDTPPSAPVMNDEIFGPVLPVIGFRSREEALSIIRRHPDPLSFYVYTSSKRKEREWLDSVPSGGACVNNSSWHLTNHHLPFGGRGNSGLGQYHGRFTFDTFSHRKAVMKTPTWFDPSIRYPSLKGRLKLFKKIVK
jgi:aldehyde dehydrogenase (NAD+)